MRMSQPGATIRESSWVKALWASGSSRCKTSVRLVPARMLSERRSTSRLIQETTRKARQISTNSTRSGRLLT